MQCNVLASPLHSASALDTHCAARTIKNLNWYTDHQMFWLKDMVAFTVTLIPKKFFFTANNPNLCL